MALHLYNFTLQNPGAVTHAITGNFVDAEPNQILVARGHILELLRFDGVKTSHVIVSTEVFGVIRSLATFRLHGTSKDYIIIGSDSGKIVIVEYSPERNAFVKVHEETFGRSGARRIVPGQYLAVDPAGRAAMIGAIEKQKFVYILTRDNQAKLTISSPLEAHKSHSLVFDMVGVDVGFMNPVFATIEVDYAEADADSTGYAAENAKKCLVWYELDLGLNHVVRKSSDVIDYTSHKLLQVPGGEGDLPGGVLICAKSCVYYRNSKGVTHKAVIPRRLHTLMTSETGEADDGVLIIASVMYRQDKTFWWLLQTEHGDLFHVSLQHNKDTVHGITLQYLDTVAPAADLVITGTILHVFSEVGNDYMYNVIDVPSADENVTFEAKDTSMTDGKAMANGAMEVDENGNSNVKLYFKPRALKYLVMLDGEIPSLSPVLDVKVAQGKAADEAPRILALCGSGARSSLSVLKHGLQVEQKANAPLANVTGVWTLKTKGSMEFDQYIVVSFASSTLILSVGDSVQQISDEDPLSRSFIDSAATLNIGRLADDTIVQVHGGGIRHIRSELSNQELPCPQGRSVVHSAMNERQVVLALNGVSNNLVYYESDGASKLLPPHSLSVGGEILAVAIQPLPPNRQRARFLAVAVADDKGAKINIYSLDPNELMQVLSFQMMSWRTSSLSILTLDAPSSYAPSSSSSRTSASPQHQQGMLTLGVGSTNGIFSRFQVDPNTGEISDSKEKALGNKPIKLYAVKMPNGALAMGASSSRPWILYSHCNALRMTPISYTAFDHAYSFHSDLCQHGIVCATPDNLAIIAPEGYARTFDHRKIPLSYTPRQSCLHPINGHLLIVESDHNADPIQERERLQAEMTAPAPASETGDEGGVLPETLYGCPKPGPKQWGSCIRMVEIDSGKTLDLVSLDNNEAALSLTTCTFSEHSGEVFVCVGTAKDLVLQPKRSCSAAYIHVYSLVDHGRKLHLLHKKQVEDIPGALTMYDHRLLAGIGKSLKIYDLGKRNPQLLRKCENNGFPNHIVSISTTRDRIIVGDIQESIHYVKYSRPASLTIFADDTTPRWITSLNVLDFDTVAGSDKFGNVFVLRVPEKVSRVESEMGGKAFSSTAPALTNVLGGAEHKLELLSCFHVGETVTRVQKVRLTPGGAEFLLYATVFGTLGALLPLTSRGSVDFFSQLELYLRQENPPLCGRDHLAYRSSYFPVKNVTDGDLLEQFATLPQDKQKTISDHLDIPIPDILRKIEDIRSQL